MLILSRIGNAERSLVTDDQIPLTYEQIHIDHIGVGREVFVIDYKRSCKHLQAFPSGCGRQPRQMFSAEALAGCLLIAH